MSFDGPQSFSGHQPLPPPTAAALATARPVPPHLLGTRAALFHIWHGACAKAAPHHVAAPAAQGPVLQSPVLQSPDLQSPDLQSMVSGTVTARFAYEMPARVRMTPQVTSLPPDPVLHPAPAAEPDAGAIRQARLKQALLDDMFIF